MVVAKCCGTGGVMVNDVEYQCNQRRGPFVCDCTAEFFVFCFCRFGGGDVSEDVVGGVEQGLQFCVELSVVELNDFHPSAEYGEPCENGRGECFVGVEETHRFHQMRHECVDLVVCPGAFAREFDNPDVGCPDVECDCSYLVIYIEDDVAGVAFRFWDVCSDKSGEVAVYDFNDITVFEVNIFEREIREAVPVCPCDVFEICHVVVGNHGISFF